MPAVCYLIAGIIMIFYELTEDKISFYTEENAKNAKKKKLADPARK